MRRCEDSAKIACFTDYSGEAVEEVPEFCGAYIDPERGTLKVVGVDPADYPPMLSIFGEGVYHVYDYQFFYRNLQANVAERIKAYGAGDNGRSCTKNLAA